MNRRPRLLFVSPRFLFPTDSGGKIRTTQILRGLKGGIFEVTLLSPAENGDCDRYQAQLLEVSDRFRSWEATSPTGALHIRRVLRLLSSLPVSVADERSEAGSRLVRTEVETGYDLVVIDFPHAAVLVPAPLKVASLLFTHNVECEIYRRHAEVSSSRLMRRIWASQQGKMQTFERAIVQRFDSIVAVSERDAAVLKTEFGARHVTTIPTGVDLEYFGYSPPARSACVVFTGGLDWAPNVDGISFLMDEVWPLVLRAIPDAKMKVIGKAPPDQLIKRSQRMALNWEFTGFVDDVRSHVRDGAVYAVPLRIGGGTRLKVYEAMALGIPIVSTTIGVEGLPVIAGQHYLLADAASEFASALIALLRNPQRALDLSRAARKLVEDHFSFRAAAEVFERACLNAMSVRNTAKSSELLGIAEQC